MLVKLNGNHFIQSDHIDEMEIDTPNNQVKIISYTLGVRTIEPEHGESIEDIATAIFTQVNGTHYNLFEAQTR